MGKLESGHINVNGGETQLAILSEIAKYFPIDTENKLSIIEEKLATKNFFLDVVSLIEIQIFSYCFNSIQYIVIVFEKILELLTFMISSGYILKI